MDEPDDYNRRHRISAELALPSDGEPVPDLSLYHNCDSTTIRLRYDDTTTHSTTTEVIEF